MMASLVLLDNTWPGYIMVELFSEIKSVTINHKEVQTSNKLFYCSNVDLFEYSLNCSYLGMEMSVLSYWLIIQWIILCKVTINSQN